MTQLETPLVSVMMPAYNAEQFVSAAMRSVLEQTLQDWELIVVDDGSTDRTYEMACGAKDPRVLVTRQENAGEAAARNTALELIRGKYLAFLDADDLFFPNHLESAIERLESHIEIDAVYTDGIYIDADGNRLGKLSAHRRGPFEGRIFDEVVRASDVFGPPICVVLRSDLLKRRMLYFDSRIVIGPDWDFLTRVSETARFGYVDRITCLYRVHAENVTVRVDRSRRAESLAICRRKAIRMPAFSSCPLEVRTAVFYDLLVNLMSGQSARRLEITEWPQFLSLPDGTRSLLFRLMAGDHLLRGQEEETDFIGNCLAKAVGLNPSDYRGRILRFAYETSPTLSRALLRGRRAFDWKRSHHTPFGSRL